MRKPVRALGNLIMREAILVIKVGGAEGLD